MATILLVGVDLFFRSKLEGLLPAHHLVTSDSADPPDLVICDITRVEPDEVADAWPDIPIVGFTNHTDKAGLQRAHAAGFDQVIVKSALVERASSLVDELVFDGQGRRATFMGALAFTRRAAGSGRCARSRSRSRAC